MEKHSPQRTLLAACTVAALLACAGGLAFLPHRSIWVDETTQLSGLTLSPVEVVPWLAGQTEHDFGVPDDRMPPVSYWAQYAWASVFGFAPGGLRFFGVLCFAFGAPGVVLAANRASGLWAAWAAGLLYALSPNAVWTASEIRAYPLFLALSAWSAYAFMRIAATENPARPRDWLLLFALLLLATYTHFFGLILGCAALGALALLGLPNRRQSAIRIGLTGLFLLLCAGLAPFIGGAVGISETETAPGLADWIKDLARWGYRLIGHPILSLSHPILAVTLFGAAAAAGLALWASWNSRARLGLLAVLILAAGAVVAGSAAVTSFPVTAPKYSVWLLPWISILLAGGIASPNERCRQLSFAAIGLTLIGFAYGGVQLAIHGKSYTPLRFSEIEKTLAPFPSGELTLIHDGPDPEAVHWGMLYMPSRYTYGPNFTQYAPTGTDELAVLPDAEELIGVSELQQPYLAIARTEQQGASDVARQVRNGIEAIEPGMFERAILASGEWRAVEEIELLAYAKTRVTIYERND